MHLIRNLAPVEFPGIDIAYGLSPSPVRDRKHTLTSNIFGSSASQWTKMILERTWNKLHYSFFTAHDRWSASTHTSASVGIWSKGISTSLSRCKFHIFRYRVTICNTEYMVFMNKKPLLYIYIYLVSIYTCQADQAFARHTSDHDPRLFEEDHSAYTEVVSNCPLIPQGQFHGWIACSGKNLYKNACSWL